MKVLILGGYGTFGFGMAERLKNEVGLELILAGRSLTKAQAACDRLAGAATLTAKQLDRNAFELDFKPDLIVDASGPFQAYENLSVVDYCLVNAISYADISDDGRFVAAVMAKGDVAKTAEIFLVSGLSTCPVLSAIGLREVEHLIGPAADVTIGVAPSPKAELGRNVVAAVASYAGQDNISVLRNGARLTIAGLSEVRNQTICVPGDIPLKHLPFAAADAPDAWALPHEFTALKHIWTGAGTQPIWLQRLLVLMAKGVARGLLPKLTQLSDLFHRARGLLRFGVHRGGIVVRASNDKGDASWHLVAEGDHGPRIPALPTVALVRKMLRGESIDSGAYSGCQVIGLPELKNEFEQLDIAYGLHFDGQQLAVYEQVLGSAYSKLFPAIMDLHRTDKGRVFSGSCAITRGLNPLSNIVAAIMGFPQSGTNVPLTVTVTPTATGETWTRDFDGQIFSSHHSLGTSRWARHITERFGPMAIHLAILEEVGNLRLQCQGWSLFGVLLPRFLRPGGDLFETQDDQGRFVFHVDLRAPLFGRLCKYEGWLEAHST